MAPMNWLVINNKVIKSASLHFSPTSTCKLVGQTTSTLCDLGVKGRREASPALLVVKSISSVLIPFLLHLQGLISVYIARWKYNKQNDKMIAAISTSGLFNYSLCIIFQKDVHFLS